MLSLEEVARALQSRIQHPRSRPGAHGMHPGNAVGKRVEARAPGTDGDHGCTRVVVSTVFPGSTWNTWVADAPLYVPIPVMTTAWKPVWIALLV